MKIKTHLILSFTAILLIFSGTIFTITYLSISGIIRLDYQNNIVSNSRLFQTFFNKSFPGEWNIKDNMLYKGDSKINDSTEFVDTIKKEGGYLTTIFLNDTRISTNVFTNGKRAVGSKASDKVIDTVLRQGKPYQGEAIVENKSCFTYYTPIKDGTGKIIGMWFVGIEKTVVDAEVRNFVGIVGLVMLLALIVGAFFAYRIGNKLSKYIIEINERLNMFANGDFSGGISEKAKAALGEIGQISKSAQIMHESITGVIMTINQESHNIDNALESSIKGISELNSNIIEVSATTEQLSAGMQQTAASMQEMNATSTDIEASIENIARKALETSSAANDISKMAEKLKSDAKASKDYAYDIYRTTNTELKNAIEQSKSIEQIKLLSDVIMQITSQTNLLALNAAIEASRAGEAGRGFAVVSDEIRKLAEDSKNTVSQIQTVTKTVFSAVEDLVSGSQNVLNFIENTVISDYNTQVETSEKYSLNATHIDELVADFSTTSEELLVQIGNMLKAINEVTVSTNESAEGTSDIAARAGIIMDQGAEVIRLAEASKVYSDNLRKYISNFKI
jgi:methyl-accepting chemotaxis protein